MAKVRLTQAQKSILDELVDGPILALRYSSGKTADQLERKGLIRLCGHPTTMDRGLPAAAYELTDDGRKVAARVLNTTIEALRGSQ